MKNQNPPKKLTLIKNTIAHLNVEQMDEAKGGALEFTYRACTVTLVIESVSCDTVLVLD